MTKREPVFSMQWGSINESSPKWYGGIHGGGGMYPQVMTYNEGVWGCYAYVYGDDKKLVLSALGFDFYPKITNRVAPGLFVKLYGRINNNPQQPFRYAFELGNLDQYKLVLFNSVRDFLELSETYPPISQIKSEIRQYLELGE